MYGSPMAYGQQMGGNYSPQYGGNYSPQYGGNGSPSYGGGGYGGVPSGSPPRRSISPTRTDPMYTEHNPSAPPWGSPAAHHSTVMAYSAPEVHEAYYNGGAGVEHMRAMAGQQGYQMNNVNYSYPQQQQQSYGMQQSYQGGYQQPNGMAGQQQLYPQQQPGWSSGMAIGAPLQPRGPPTAGGYDYDQNGGWSYQAYNHGNRALSF